MLRDQALFVGGLLVETVGGPSVKPPQPAGLWEAVAYTDSNTAHFTADTGAEKVHRRSLYTFWKRTAAAAADDHLRRPFARGLPGPPRADQHAAPGPPADERAAVSSRRRAPWPSGPCAKAGPTTDDRLTYMFRLVTARGPDAKDLAELTVDSQGPDGPLRQPSPTPPSS